MAALSRAALPTELLSSRIGGQCREISTVLEKTAEPGRYTARECWGPFRAAPATHGHMGPAGSFSGWPLA